MSESKRLILRVFDAYRAAVLAKDVAAFVALYDSDAVVFDMWGTWCHRGREAWRAVVADWFGSLGTGHVVVEMDHIKIHVAGTLAVAHAFVAYRGVSAQGESLRAMDNRLTWALTQDSGAWVIVHEHTSSPIALDTTKAMFERQ